MGTKEFFKNPMKMFVAVIFVVVMGLGVSTSMRVNKGNGDVDLLSLNSVLAQGEGGVQNRDPDDDECMYYHWLGVWLPGVKINCEVGTLWCVESECS